MNNRASDTKLGSIRCVSICEKPVTMVSNSPPPPPFLPFYYPFLYRLSNRFNPSIYIYFFSHQTKKENTTDKTSLKHFWLNSAFTFQLHSEIDETLYQKSVWIENLFSNSFYFVNFSFFSQLLNFSLFSLYLIF